MSDSLAVETRSLAVKPGDVLRDKYRIDALIGRGGMGQVFAATVLDSSAREQVALKVVSRLLVDETLMIRLHREAEAAARIRSDFVPRVLDVSDTEDGETFLVMERLVGEPLSQRIRDNGALPWSEVARIGEDVLRALIDAHTAGIVHRDLKPSNVFLALKAGRVRAMVLDFGVCKMDGVDTERLTGTGESIGTVAYMAPEQIRGAARVDERADLYGFGVLVFEMLCGRLPHEGPSQMAILASKLENASARLNDWSRVSTPEGADALIARTLAREPAQRPANAQELLKAWRALSKTDTMIAAGSVPPPRLSSADDELTSGGDAPTEVSRPAMTKSPSVADRVARIERGDDSPHDVANDGEQATFAVYPPPSLDRDSHRSDPALLPPHEPHPTQTSLTTHHTSSRRNGGGARLALLLAAGGLVVGIIIVGVSFTRDEPRATTGASSAKPPPDHAAAGTSEISGETAPADSSESFELPSEATSSEPPAANASGGSKPRPHPHGRPRPVGPPPASKGSGPRITSQPRY
jgi:eukaryotic-like serine/threonine-protein kinase